MLKALWVDGWLNTPCAKEKLADMGFGGRWTSPRVSTAFSNDKIRKLSEEGKLKEALHIVERITRESSEAPKGAFICLLRGCTRKRALTVGKQLHSLIVQTKYDTNIFLSNLLIDMYSNCGSIGEASKVFTAMSQRNVFSWTAMISAYVNNGQHKEALTLFQQMQETGIEANKFACVVVLQACTSVSDVKNAQQIHALIVKGGFESDVIVQTSLIDMYGRCGCLKVAHELFNKMPQRDVVSWNVMIAAYARTGLGKDSLNLFEQMKHEGMEPNKVTFVLLLKACACISALEQGKQLHSLILEKGVKFEKIIQTALVDMYAKCGCLEDARELFSNILQRDVVSWNAMISGYAQKGLGKEALDLYEKMKYDGMEPNEATFSLLLKACASISALEQGQQLHSLILAKGFESETTIQNCLVDMYAKCGCIKDARELFNNMPRKDMVSWNAMIASYTEEGLGEEALNLYEQMKPEHMEPDDVTLVLLLKACANISALEQGRQFHSLILEKGLELETTIQTTLVDMYSKCGCLTDARLLFKEMNQRDVVSWNAMIAGCAQEGLGEEALDLYKQMKHDGLQANESTYTSVLSACSHSHLVDEGRHVFESMFNDHGVTPTLEHYACMVDLLSRAGFLDDAENLSSL